MYHVCSVVFLAMWVGVATSAL